MKVRLLGRTFILGLLVLGTLFLRPTPALACSCYGYLTTMTNSHVARTYTSIIQFLVTDYYSNYLLGKFYQDKIVKDLWEQNVSPALKDQTSQISAFMTYLTGVQGKFFDAEIQIETQRQLQKNQALTVRNYTPSDALCRFGTGVRTLSAAEKTAFQNRKILSEMSLRRMLGNKGGQADTGENMDRRSRLLQFARIYCDPADNDGQLAPICKIASSASGPDYAAEPSRFNKDIDFTRTIASSLTLNLNYGDGALTRDEEDVRALGNNLYGHDVFRRISEMTAPSEQDKFLQLRQIAAARSVAFNSYSTLTGMRSRSTVGSGQFLRQALQEMGFSAEESSRFLGSDSVNSGEPSYYAQMEVLTKKLYQNPNFYVNLIDKPTNVTRQQAAMKAFSLMQNRDIFQSLERQEMMMALLAEIEIRAAQDVIQRDLEGRDIKH